MPEPTPTPSVIAILDTDTTVPSIQHSHGKYYSAAYIHHLTAAATAASLPVPTFTTHNVLEDAYPDPAAVSAILITGSIAAAYDTHPWVLRLAAFIADVYANHRHVRIFGTCFGHQLIGQVLLGPHGAVVEKDPAGYEFGVQTIALHPRLVAEYPCLRGLAQVDDGQQKDVRGLRLQMCHGDHVALPATLPGSWLNIGGSAQCAVQGLYEPSRVLTIQPHFEGDQVMMEETIKHFYTPEKGFSPEFLEKAFEGTRRQDDAGVAAEWVLRFLLGIS
ncbi:putative glutamine amidotransferase-like protein [Colletotrichum aenigma]|uniref:putative glutamine amidotransferase-like protein n=1 Tax=Colletotrichum aenigma TaxID=1215731 RepID=UPI001872E7AC|nr:putative glutamine amidotransferase-like protein [Colletotrichum aenigma]KAF5507194.1 putative glutamine amidotransferase-like protein [Colletotrichum aenigma]